MRATTAMCVFFICVSSHGATARVEREAIPNNEPPNLSSTIPECVISEDCAPDRICASQQCQDPCLKVCGNNTICQVTDHIPVCMCYPGYIGNPVVGCHKPGIADCITNEDCPSDKMCVSQRCRDPCLNFCGVNTFCNMSKHFPVCSCLKGFIGNPIEGCHKAGAQMT